LGAAPVSNPCIASGVMQAETICLETSHGRGFLVAVIALVGAWGRRCRFERP
jgi:hypothetical protein